MKQRKKKEQGVMQLVKIKKDKKKIIIQLQCYIDEFSYKKHL